MTAYALAIANMIAGFLLLCAGLDFFRFPDIYRGGKGGGLFWIALGTLVVISGIRLWL